MDQDMASSQVITEIVDWSGHVWPVDKLLRAVLLGPVSFAACLAISGSWRSTGGLIVSALWAAFSLGMSIYAFAIFLRALAGPGRKNTMAGLWKAIEDRIGEAKFRDVHTGVGGVSAIAVNPTRRLVLVADGKKLTTIPWSAVRSWEWSVPGADRVTVLTGGLADHLQAGVLNTGAKIRADLASGITFEVKDTSTPTINFRCNSVPMLKRWHEILRQMNEGDLR